MNARANKFFGKSAFLFSQECHLYNNMCRVNSENEENGLLSIKGINYALLLSFDDILHY